MMFFVNFSLDSVNKSEPVAWAEGASKQWMHIVVLEA
jgi:hypothetical protein